MTATLDPVATRTTRKITRRLMPFLLLLYITAYIDRVNVSFAGLDMTRELGFSNAVFGFGSGIFFFGYSLLEIPGAMLVEAWSARKWIATIMIGWGILASITGFIHNATEFNIIRFLVGLAEGGFFPAVVVYLTHWYRYEDRGKAVAMFMAAIPVSFVIGSPLSGMLMRLDWLGLSGWRWLLILEGIPAFLGGVATLLYLPDRPKDARWLGTEEREWITGELARELHQKRQGEHHHLSILQAFRKPIVLALAFSYFLVNTSNYGLTIWLPKIVQKLSGLSTLQLSLILALPYLAAVPAMLVNGWHSDKTGERRWHAGLAALMAAVGLALSQISGASPAFAVAMFTIAAMAIMSYYPPFWALPTRLLSARTAAASFGFMNLIANLGGFAGPYMVGFLTDRTGSYAAGVYLLVSTAVLSAVVLALIRPPQGTATASSAATA
jgi:MFS transporter, ACS family, tartrate transporter